MVIANFYVLNPPHVQVLGNIFKIWFDNVGNEFEAHVLWQIDQFTDIFILLACMIKNLYSITL